ncbi:MAG: histidine kinase dimerization/phospho-acceptor domain-containing protein, partial [Candidatus Promineifilaceae bacterium]|nr:histidine kinase dimerization/phospho-acceptor domain-containing protein [Candidatus Promineifilaceae bacterium]
MKKASQSQIETPAPGGNEALRRGLTYGLLVAVYVGAALLLHYLVRATVGAAAPWLLVLIVLAVVLTFDAVHVRFQAVVDGALAGEQAAHDELSMLQQLDRDLSTTLDLEQVVSVTLDWALRLCQGTAGALVLTNDEGRPSIHAARGYDDTFDPEAVPADTLEAGLVGEVLRTGRHHVTGDVHEHENYVAAASDVKSQLTVPLTFQQETVGAIAIEKDVRDAFSDEDVECAVRLANHAGAAIANALLHRQVIAANEAKSEFVSLVSHELKTPLTAIRGYADLMLGGMTGDVNERQRKFLQTIGRNIEKTNQLIQDLTEISRIETGKLNVEPAPISFATVVSESV